MDFLALFLQDFRGFYDREKLFWKEIHVSSFFGIFMYSLYEFLLIVYFDVINFVCFLKGKGVVKRNILEKY